MAAFTLAQIGFAALALVFFRIIYEVYRSYQVAKFARAHGCEEPFNISGQWPFSILDGWSRLWHTVDVVKAGGDIIDDAFAKQLEPANTTMLTNIDGTMGIDTIEPANIQAMLATQFKDFGMGKMRINQFYPVLGNSIFSSDGSDWEHSRALFRPQFNREQINDMDETEKASQQLISALGPTDPSTGWTKGCELLPLLYNFTLDTATAFLFGESVNSQTLHASQQIDSESSARAKQFMQDFELASQYMMRRIRSQSFYWLSDSLAFRRAVRRIRSFTEHFVQRVLDPTAREKAAFAGKKKYNLLAALATQSQNHTELRNQTLAILIAGRDTTAGLLGWSFERLALHPEIFQNLRKIILQDFPLDSTEPLSFAKLKGCRYLQHFLNEVLRLHPNVPVNNRTAVRDTTLPLGGGPDQKSPVAIPKNTPVTFSVYLMHRRKDLWGEDALEFKPGRWAEGKIPAWQFLPFSGGSRICLGQQFALTEASYVLVRMLQSFDAVEPVGERKEMERLRKGLGLTMWPADGVPVRFRRAAA